MSKRAEQRGLEALPPRWRKTKDGKGKVDSALPVRKFYIRAYEQGQKETIDRAVEWLKEHWVKFPNPDVPTEIVVEQFKKAMEEEVWKEEK